MNDTPAKSRAGSAFDDLATAEAFAADVIAFAAVQDIDSVAKLIAFFHLASPAGRTNVDFRVESDGRLTLHVEVEGG